MAEANRDLTRELRALAGSGASAVSLIDFIREALALSARDRMMVIAYLRDAFSLSTGTCARLAAWHGFEAHDAPVPLSDSEVEDLMKPQLARYATRAARWTSESADVLLYEADDWRVLAETAKRRLEEFLGQPLIADVRANSQEAYERGFSLQFRSEASAAPQPGTSRVILRADLYETTKRARVSAIVFFYVLGQKVAPNGKDFLELELDRSEDSAQWHVVGWYLDEQRQYREMSRDDR